MSDLYCNIDMNEITLYVSPGGNDQWTGRWAEPTANGTDGPFATLAAARDAVRCLKAAQAGNGAAVTVRIAAGIYELAETLRFTPVDSGTAGCPVRYAAAPGAAPVVSGGRRITGWRETEHNGRRCWTVELPDVAAGRWNFTRLYVNDAPRPRPRLPKTGHYRFIGTADFPDTGHRWCHGPDRASFAPGEIRRWHNWQDAELITYQLWFDTHHRFKDIDEATNVAYFQANSLGSLRDERDDFARYVVENVFEALDTPGEWYLDRGSGLLRYLPLAGETMENTVITAPRLTELVRIEGDNAGRRAAHLQFENLAFAHQHWELPRDCPGYIQAAWGVPGALVLEGAEDCTFYGCHVAHVNGYGIEVLAGSTENTIAACTVHDAGAGGVKIGHESWEHTSATGKTVASRPDLLPLATTVADCSIRDCGHLFPSAVGIWIGNSGWNRVVHNRIFDCTYTGISCGWTWGYKPTRAVCNRIENNHIHHINKREILSDNGGIYTLGRQPGTTVRGNIIHDIACYGYGAWGIYPDEGSAQIRFENNLVCGTQKAAFSCHYGRDNLVQHNIFALSREDHVNLGKCERHRSTVFRHNVVVTANGLFQGRSWARAHFSMRDNLFWTLDGTPPMFNREPLDALQAAGQNTGAVVADPLFTDAAGGDFALRPDSPVHAIGFETFDWRAAGPRLGAERPATYADYAGRFALPSNDVPVVDIVIEPVSATDAATADDRHAAFVITLTNLGRMPAHGCVRFESGPAGHAGAPSMREMRFVLPPGATHGETVTFTVAAEVEAFWLDCEPADMLTVPARGLAFAPQATSWQVPLVPETKVPARVQALLAQVPARRIRHGERLLAEVRLGAQNDALLVHALFHEPHLRPDPAVPWHGTGFELLAFPQSKAGAPQGQTPAQPKLFLLPCADGVSADTLSRTESGSELLQATDVSLAVWPFPGGVELAAVVPWRRLGCEERPDELLFELVVNALNPATGGIVQEPAFVPLSDGARRLNGCLLMTTTARIPTRRR